MLAGLPIPSAAIAEITSLLRTNSDEHSSQTGPDLSSSPTGSSAPSPTRPKILALTIDERAIILAALEDPPETLSELRAVLLNEHQWRRREGLG